MNYIEIPQGIYSYQNDNFVLSLEQLDDIITHANDLGLEKQEIVGLKTPPTKKGRQSVTLLTLPKHFSNRDASY